MAPKMISAILLLCTILIVACFGKDIITPLIPSSPDAWMESGLPVADSDNLKSQDGFGAQLWLTKDDSIYETWDTPRTSKIETTKTAVRNQPIFAVFLFINPGVDEKLNADITADVTITSPDGDTYGEFKDMEIWQRVYDFPENTIQLAVGNLGIMIEDDDLLGVYTVKAVIKDKIKNINLELQTEFTAQDE